LPESRIAVIVAQSHVTSGRIGYSLWKARKD
jgi:hypothetical protein